MTLGQINQMLSKDNLINMDIRTVLACAPLATGADSFAAAPTSDSFRAALRTSLSAQQAVNTTDSVLSWFTDVKTRYEMVTDRIPLNQVQRWEVTDTEIRHTEVKFLSVIAVSVQAGSREVGQWTQPLFHAGREGLAALLVKPFDGVLHALVQGKLQAGHRDLMEIAPTVQCVTAAFRDIPADRRPPFLDYVMTAPQDRIRYDALLCEEGGRFYQRENRYMVIEVEDDFPADAPANYTWVSLRQIKQLIKFSNIFDMEARTLTCCLQSLC
jgi:oxidase EvaA